MVSRKKGAGTASRNALVPIKPQPLTSATETALAAVLGPDGTVAKMPGTGGEVVRQAGVTRVTGRAYATSQGIIPASEIYFVHGAKPRKSGHWLGEADKGRLAGPGIRL